MEWKILTTGQGTVAEWTKASDPLESSAREVRRYSEIYPENLKRNSHRHKVQTQDLSVWRCLPYRLSYHALVSSLNIVSLSDFEIPVGCPFYYPLFFNWAGLAEINHFFARWYFQV